MKDPAFPFYPQDFIIGTMFMEFEDIGRYIKLLAIQWDSGKIPIERVEKIIGIPWTEASVELKNKFDRTPGYIWNQRLEDEREKRRKHKEQQSINGSKGGRPKKTENKPNQKPKETQRKPNQKPLENEGEKEEESLINKENAKKEFGFDFSFLPDEFLPGVWTWLSYKRSRKETYKTQISLEVMVKHLLQFGNNNPDTCFQVIEQSIANNWAGLFELKNRTNDKAIGTARKAIDNLDARIGSR